MPSQNDTAEDKFRSAFERLKVNRPQVVPNGTPVSQNNIAKEAGADPSALRKTRYPALIREIQTWIDIAGAEGIKLKERRIKKQQSRENTAEQILRLTAQRDLAQSQLISIQQRVLELLIENDMLKTTINELRPPPIPLRK
jgi:hypothetical protein